MLDLTFTKSTLVNEYPISPYSGNVEEGQFLVGTLDDGLLKSQPSSGVAGETPMGFAYGYFNTPTSAPSTEEVTLTDDGSGKPQAILNNVPETNTPPVAYTASLDIVSGRLVRGTPITGLSVSGNVVTGFSGKVGDVVIITYRFALTAQQAASLIGNVTQPRPAAVTETIGIIKRGRVYTSNFDTTCDWTVATVPGQIKTGPNGTLTTSGNGTVIPGAFVYQLPSADSQCLGVSIDLA